MIASVSQARAFGAMWKKRLTKLLTACPLHAESFYSICAAVARHSHVSCGFREETVS